MWEFITKSQNNSIVIYSLPCCLHQTCYSRLCVRGRGGGRVCFISLKTSSVCWRTIILLPVPGIHIGVFYYRGLGETSHLGITFEKKTRKREILRFFRLYINEKQNMVNMVESVFCRKENWSSAKAVDTQGTHRNLKNIFTHFQEWLYCI